MIIVSACLAGCRCRYDGASNTDFRIEHLVTTGQAIPVCPEQLGGLLTPRIPSEIADGSGADVLLGNAKVMSKEGKDVTNNFLRGAYETLRICKLIGAKEAILKSRSPSCGCGLIHDGTFCGTMIEGDGVTAALLRKDGINVLSEEDYNEG